MDSQGTGESELRGSGGSEVAFARARGANEFAVKGKVPDSAVKPPLGPSQRANLPVLSEKCVPARGARG